MFATCFNWLSPFVWFYVVLYFSHVPVCCFFQLILLTFGCQQLLTLLILESFILQPTFWLSVMVTVTGVVETDSHLFTSQMPTPAERHMNSLMDSKFVDERSWSSMHARRQNSHLHVSMFLVSILTYILLCCSLFLDDINQLSLTFHVRAVHPRKAFGDWNVRAQFVTRLISVFTR